MKKRFLAFALTVIMACSAVACGGDTNRQTGGKTDNSASKQGVFKIQDLEIALDEGVEGSNISAMKVVGENIYMIMDLSYSNGSSVNYIKTDLESNVLKNIVLSEYSYGSATVEEGTETTAEVQVQEYKNCYAYTFMDDGSVAYIEQNNKYYPDTMVSEDKNELVLLDADATELFRTVLEPENAETDYFYVNSIIPSKEDTLFVMAYDVILEVDKTGAVANTITPNDVTRDLYSPLFYKDGMPVFTFWNEDYTETTYATVDIRTGTKGEEVALMDNISNYNMYEGGASGYDFVLASNNGVLGYNFGDTEPTKIMDYVNSDLATYRLSQVCFIDSERFIASYTQLSDYKGCVSLFTKVAPEDVPDKAVMNMAAFGKNTELLSSIINYNKTNDAYRITLTDYSEYATSENYLAGIDELNNEIISGKVPDMIYCSQNIPVSNYISKGLLVDFNELMEADDSFNRADYAENVFEAYEVDGKLYELPTSYYIWTVLGKNSIFGDDTSLTWEELDTILSQYPGATAFKQEITKTQMLSNGLQFMYARLVDEAAGTCEFNTEEFKGLLEFANTFPDEIDYDALYNDEDYWSNYESQFIENRVLLNQSTIYSIYEAWRGGFQTFLEEITPVGFPVEDGETGSTVNAISSYVIFKKSEHVDAAWEFIKSFLSEESQIKTNENGDARYSYWGIPVLKKAIEDSASYITKKPTYMDENGDQVEQDNYVYVNGQEVLVEPASQEEMQRWIDFVLSVDQKGAGDLQDELAIITEEAEGYFSGQKSLDEVIGIIQSRMNIFISENS